ncbi:hypothetical protein [Nesterenkonia sp.]|uniref:hypothetical protein n=1 Tax=Nesterenkonia sp. TaxID=704201 RepID=UPI002603979B|nr:hypothetical protein [Nesterenkonia sp.]
MGQEWIITLADEHLDRMDEVVAQLRECGMEIGQVLRSLGQVTASGDEACARRAADVSGVSSVDASRQIRLSPPDSEVQ